MDRRKKMVRYAPAMIYINTYAMRISHYKHVLSYGLWVFGATSVALLFMRSELMWLMLGITLLMSALYWRWTYLSNHVRDAWFKDYPLTEPLDFQWLEWARDLEPEVDLWLLKHRPDGRYTARDFQQAYWRHAYYWSDVPRRAPYFGDIDACFEDLELRRTPQRSARAERLARANSELTS